MNKLEGKVALVTGGALGIGKAVSMLFAKEGAKVAVLDTLEQEAAQVAKEIEKAGGDAKAWLLDVSKEKDVKRVIEAVYHTYGRLDVLVNNAGISGVSKPTDEISEVEWDLVMAVNVKGVFFCTKYAVPLMKKGGGGSIINLSSIYGIVSAPDVPPYHASKGAVRMMSKTDALLYAKDKIRVNSVHPGFIWTPMVEKYAESLGDVTAMRVYLDSLHPIGHMGEPDDIAYGVLYLASNESKFVTGTELVIDGGYTAR